MAGQPNRRPRSEVPPTDVGGKATPIVGGLGLGSHEIDHAWVPTDDVRVLNDRLRRRKAQVEKLKSERADLRVAIKLKTEEAYNEGLLSVAPKLLALDLKAADLAERILTRSENGIDEDDLKALKLLLAETSKMRDRLYGKTRQRVQSSSLSASVDINELMRQGRDALPELASEGDDAVIDLEPVDEEVIDG